MTTRTIEISNTDDVIDVRDIIARVEQLEAELSPADESDGDDNEERAELALLVGLLDELKGNGGDEEYKGDWYPVTLVRDSYFTDYAQQEVEDCGYIAKDFPSWIEVNWEATADNMRVDYSMCEFDGVDYLYR